MYFRSQMSDLAIKVFQKKTEGDMSSDLKRKISSNSQPRDQLRGNQSLRLKKSNSEASGSDSSAHLSDLPYQRKTELQFQKSDECKV